MSNSNNCDPPDCPFEKSYQWFLIIPSARISQKIQIHILNVYYTLKVSRPFFQANFSDESQIFQNIQSEKMQSAACNLAFGYTNSDMEELNHQNQYETA